MLELQQHGKSTHTAHNISFNNICAHFKLPENPLKEKFKNILWKMENSDNNNLLNNEAPLTEEVIFYSAFDVYPLHRSGCRHHDLELEMKVKVRAVTRLHVAGCTPT